MHLKSRLPQALTMSLLAAAFAGCTPAGKQAEPQGAASAPTVAAKNAEVVIQTASPDLAVKSWWSLFDALELNQYKECISYAQRRSGVYKDAPAIATGEMLATLSESPVCVLETYSRDIDSVNVETETRAIVLATVRISTPIPPGASTDLESRRAGEKFRYVVEKIEGKWKLAMVYRRRSHLSDSGWEKVYEKRDTPYVSSMIVLQ